MFITRTISAAVFAAIFIGAAYVGGIWFLLFVGLVYVLGVLEFLEMAQKQGIQPDSGGLFVAGLALLGLAYFPEAESMLLPGFAVIVLALCAWHLRRGPKGIWRDLGATLSGFAYFGLLIAFLVLLLREGFGMVIGALIFTWASDVLAYIVGSLIGRHKLAPEISPSKSIEGSIAGLAGAVAIAYPWALVFGIETGPALAIGALAGIAAQAGDLLESALKRDAGVKDSGAMIPGHGGILDRFDSLLFVAPVVYLALRILHMA